MHYHCMVDISFNSPCFTTSVYIPGFLPLKKNECSHEHSYYRTHDRRSNCNGTRSIVSSLYQARDYVELSYNTSDHNTTVSYRQRYIAKYIAFGSYNDCFTSCKFCTITMFFYMWLFWQQFTVPFWSNKKFSRFCSSFYQLWKSLHLLRPFAASDIFVIFFENGVNKNLTCLKPVLDRDNACV